MIVQPDFADHWKTELLVRLSDSESAVRCVLRFWSHCQNRKKWTFEGMNPATLAAICKWTGDEEVFWDAMTQTFLDVNGTSVTAHEWESVNSRLIHNWSVGVKGGRPSKPKDNGEITQGITQGVTDREDRKDKIDRERERSRFPR